jgi:hypothetical protein
VLKAMADVTALFLELPIEVRNQFTLPSPHAD